MVIDAKGEPAGLVNGEMLPVRKTRESAGKLADWLNSIPALRRHQPYGVLAVRVCEVTDGS